MVVSDLARARSRAVAAVRALGSRRALARVISVPAAVHAVALIVVLLADGASPPSTSAKQLALSRPPMGWNPWYRYHCNVNEALVEQTAQLMVKDGFVAAGYNYVNLDDCWTAPNRTASGQLQSDPKRFPHGIAWLASYVHGLGLGFGMYLDAGKQTCKHYLGSEGHIAQDVATLAAWGVDFVKVDYCNTGLPPPAPVYNQIFKAFNAVARPMVLSICDWGLGRPWNWAPTIATMWRTTHDYTYYKPIGNFWNATLIIANINAGLARYAHPGAWNDPDLLLAGTGTLTPSQERAQMSLWAMMAAPLLMDADLSHMSQSTYQTLTNSDVIAVDQDPAGIQGERVGGGGLRQTWLRQLQDGSRVVLLFNSGSYAAPMSVALDRIGLPARSTYLVRDLWSHRTFISGQTLAETVEPNDVMMLRVWPLHTTSSTGGVAVG